MSRLLNAEFHRLIKYKPYWIECIAVVLYGIYATLLNDFGYTPSIDSFLFEALPYICIITGVVFSQFIGEDYTCGTIRNKLINGHTRKTYYLTEIIVIFLANVTVFNLYVITTILARIFLNSNSFERIHGFFKTFQYFLRHLSLAVPSIPSQHLQPKNTTLLHFQPMLFL